MENQTGSPLNPPTSVESVGKSGPDYLEVLQRLRRECLYEGNREGAKILQCAIDYIIGFHYSSVDTSKYDTEYEANLARAMAQPQPIEATEPLMRETQEEK